MQHHYQSYKYHILLLIFLIGTIFATPLQADKPDIPSVSLPMVNRMTGPSTGELSGPKIIPPPSSYTQKNPDSVDSSPVVSSARNSTDPLQASFSIILLNNQIPGTARFTDTSTGNPDSWFWSFGDNNVSADQNPEHEYQTTGPFLVSLTIRKGTMSQTVTQMIPSLTSLASEENQVLIQGDFYLPNWMTNLDGRKSIAEFSIPGTHESAARYDPPLISDTAKCQDTTISQQLNQGIRFLDIRCRHFENAFSIHHGSVYQKLNFDDVLKMCRDFLKDNPTECIIMSVKEEYNAEKNTRTFAQTFYQKYYLPNKDLIYIGNSIPQLQDVRGKIVLIRRFNNFGVDQNLGIDASTNWNDDDPNFCLVMSNICIQDKYNLGCSPSKSGEKKIIDKKYQFILDKLNNAVSQKPDTLQLNFASGYLTHPVTACQIPCIKVVASQINRNLNSFFSAGKKGRYGVILMDYAESDLNRKIIATNTFHQADYSFTIGKKDEEKAVVSFRYIPHHHEIDTFTWDFGDGEEGSGENVVHTFYRAKGDTYKVLLTTRHPSGQIYDEIQKTIHPFDTPDCDWKYVNQGYDSYMVVFTDRSSNENPKIYMKSYKWDFGDNTSSLEKNPMHNYAAPGNYLVNHSVINQYNNIDSEIRPIVVR